MLSINYKDPRPIYEQVRDRLRTLILSGALAPDEKLPSVRELAGQLAINPNTIQRAYRELEALGLIYTAAGRGAFVASGTGAADRRKQELLEQLAALAAELQVVGVTREELLAALEGAAEGAMAARAASEDAAVEGAASKSAAAAGSAANGTDSKEQQ